MQSLIRKNIIERNNKIEFRITITLKTKNKIMKSFNYIKKRNKNLLMQKINLVEIQTYQELKLNNFFNGLGINSIKFKQYGKINYMNYLIQ